MRRAGVGSAEGSLWAAGGALGALEGHGQPRVCIFVDSALPAHAVRRSVRVSCSTNFLLHEGMLVVCVRVRRLFSFAPPTIAPTIYPLFLIQTFRFCISLPLDLERGGLRSPIGNCDFSRV